jgi:hypothetical protein
LTGNFLLWIGYSRTNHAAFNAIEKAEARQSNLLGNRLSFGPTAPEWQALDKMFMIFMTKLLHLIAPSSRMFMEIRAAIGLQKKSFPADRELF